MFLQLTTTAQGENYEPILKEGNVWTSGCAFRYWAPFTTYGITKFKAKADTTILGVDYRKIYWHSGESTFIDSLAQYYCAAREDGPRLYLRPPNSEQYLLHLDLSAEVGDVLTIYSGYDFQDVKVNNVRETDDGRKIVSLERLNCYIEDYSYHAWVEGIGSTRGLYDGLFGCEYFDTCYDVLLCLEEEEDNITYQLGADCNYIYEFSANFNNIEDTTICLGQSIGYVGYGGGGLGPYSMYAIPQTDEDTIIVGSENFEPFIILRNLDGKVDLLDYELWQWNRAKLGVR